MIGLDARQVGITACGCTKELRSAGSLEALWRDHRQREAFLPFPDTSTSKQHCGEIPR